MTTKTVLVQVRTGMAVFQGILTCIVGLSWLALGIASWRQSSGDSQVNFLGVAGCLAVLALAAYFFGIAIRKPVALRMDDKGISGFYAEPAVWPEIMAIETYTGSKGRRYLCFAFLNPEMFGARQPFHRKIYSWIHNPSLGYRYQIVIPESSLKNWDVAALAAQAEAFRRAA